MNVHYITLKYLKGPFAWSSLWNFPLCYCGYFCSLSTHPIGSTHGLVVDTVALGWWQRRVPETTIALVVPDSERLYKCEAGWKKFCSNVVVWLQGGGIVKADGRRETLGRLWGSAAGLGLPFFFYNKLVGAGRRNTIEMLFVRRFSTKWTENIENSIFDWLRHVNFWTNISVNSFL